LKSAELLEEILSDARIAYTRRETELGTDNLRELERRILMSVVDRKWREHLYEMDYLKEGIGLRAMAQRDPLIEYQREGYDLFKAMLDAIREETVGFLFNLQVQVQKQEVDVDGDGVPDVEEEVLVAKGLEAPKAPKNLNYTSSDDATANADGTASNREERRAAKKAR